MSHTPAESSELESTIDMILTEDEAYMSGYTDSQKNTVAVIMEALAAHDQTKRAELLEAVTACTYDHETDEGDYATIAPSDMRQAINTVYGTKGEN